MKKTNCSPDSFAEYPKGLKPSLIKKAVKGSIKFPLRVRSGGNVTSCTSIVSMSTNEIIIKITTVAGEEYKVMRTAKCATRYFNKTRESLQIKD